MQRSWKWQDEESEIDQFLPETEHEKSCKAQDCEKCDETQAEREEKREDAAALVDEYMRQWNALEAEDEREAWRQQEARENGYGDGPLEHLEEDLHYALKPLESHCIALTTFEEFERGNTDIWSPGDPRGRQYFEMTMKSHKLLDDEKLAQVYQEVTEAREAIERKEKEIKAHQRRHQAKKDALMNLIEQAGARLARPYEHWNEEERYMEYMETRYDNDY